MSSTDKNAAARTIFGALLVQRGKSCAKLLHPCVKQPLHGETAKAGEHFIAATIK
jgi:hypothetical protein